MTQINSYTVRYSFHLDGTRKDMTATREGVSSLHVAGIESAELADLFDLPRVHLFEEEGSAFAQIGHTDGMYAALSVEWLV